MSGRIRLCLCCQIVPMLCDLAICIEAEHIKSNLLSCSCEIVNRLKEHLVSVLESSDIVDCCFYR